MAVKTHYSKEMRPMDILVLAGLTDIQKGAEYVLKKFESFRDWVINQNEKNMLSFAMVPEAYTKIEDASEKEFISQMKLLNAGIKSMNSEIRWPEAVRAPKLLSWGTSPYTKNRLNLILDFQSSRIIVKNAKNAIFKAFLDQTLKF